jgi:uncharacterized protein
MYMDPLYLVVMVASLILSGGAQLMLSRAYNKYREVRGSSGLTGAQAAAHMLRSNGITGVAIEETPGTLSDHYDPTHKVLRLSPDIFRGTSLASLGVACHEAGHALQHAKGYTPLFLRSVMVPMASFGTNAGVILMIIGMFMGVGDGLFGGKTIALAGFGLFLAYVLFSIVTLPVEFDASRRAKEQLSALGMVGSVEEQRGVSTVLNAAAMTYVAAAAIALLNLLVWAVRLGLIGGRRDD